MNKHLLPNKKTLLILCLTFPIIIFILATSSIPLNPPIFIDGSVVTEQGTVIENATELAKVDGPAYLRVKKEGGILSGSIIKVVYSPGEAECRNPISSALDIKEGDPIEIHGLAVSADTISTCESTEYYIKVRQK